MAGSGRRALALVARLTQERLASGQLACSSSAGGLAAAAAGVGVGASATTLQRVFARAARSYATRACRHQSNVSAPHLPALPRLRHLPPSGRRWCSTEGPKRKWESYYPKNRPKLPKNAEAEAKAGEAKAEGAKSTDTASMYDKLSSILMSVGILALAGASTFNGRSDAQEISFQTFKNKLLEAGLVDRIEVVNKNLAKVYVKPSASDGELTGAKATSQYKYYFNIGSVDSFERKLEDAEDGLGINPRNFVPVTYVTELSWLQELLRIAPTILMLTAFFWVTRKIQTGMGGMGGGGGGGARGIFNVGKAQVTIVDKNAKSKVTFKDVAGCDEAKQEVMEFVEFLKSPARFKDLGAKIPKGALLVGPPGTGKTLLAKATAGEAGVPFLSISGSDFMEMFVGVGPSRVRDLFAQARQRSPSIIFIDEIDAIGRARGRGGFAGGNDERENTLNQLLVEMDGFSTKSGIVVLAGTNRPDILDKALLRPGRFDRQISIDRPDINGREHIFRIYLAKLKLDQPVEYYSQRMAALTPGFAGADIANVCNEAALIAARGNKLKVDMIDFESAVDRVIGGLEKKNKVISKEERRTVAYHEAGHAVAGWFLQYAEPLLKVSIVPRGTAALGFAQYLPSENLLLTREQLLDMICMTLGGRAAEEVMLGKISTGAQNDLEKITKLAYSQVAIYGFSKRIGLLSFPPKQDAEFQKPYSEETSRMIDQEVREMVDEAYERTLKLLKENKEGVEKLAQTLLAKEVVNQEDLISILGERPYKSAEMNNYDKFKHGFQQPTIPEAELLQPEEGSGGRGGPPSIEPVPALTIGQADRS